MRDALLQAAIAGDEDAQRRIVERTAPQLRRFVDRRMGGQLRRHVSAADLVQEVYARVFRSLASLSPATERTFRARLFRHATWVLANHGERHRLAAGESAAPLPPGETPDALSDRSGVVTHADQVRWLRALVERLDAKYARVVELRLQGLSFEEIGRHLGELEATVRQRHARVLRMLRDLAGDPPA